MFEKVNEILDFWLGKPEDDISQYASLWWKADPVLDEQIRNRFMPLHQQGQAALLEDWCHSPKSCLAYIILFDQFSRNMYRGTAQAFQFDVKALNAAQTGIENKLDKDLGFIDRIFFYMPLEHSEILAHQKQSVALFKVLLEDAKQNQIKDLELIKDAYTFAIKHFEVIDRFGRFPHRNEILKRKSTKAEKMYLEEFPQGF